MSISLKIVYKYHSKDSIKVLVVSEDISPHWFSRSRSKLSFTGYFMMSYSLSEYRPQIFNGTDGCGLERSMEFLFTLIR